MSDQAPKRWYPEIEPQIHSSISDSLPNDHPLAWENVWCSDCAAYLHAFHNENMGGMWVETGRGNFCFPCFAERMRRSETVAAETNEDTEEDYEWYGLPGDPPPLRARPD